MNLSEFDYQLPPEFIAQHPIEPRDHSKLMILNRSNQSIDHRHFYELIDLLDENHVIVFNQSRVLPARLKFKINESTAEILLIKKRDIGHWSLGSEVWECMVNPGKKFKVGKRHVIHSECELEVKEILDNGLRIIEFNTNDFDGFIRKMGTMPTPPYIKSFLEDQERYQTVYSNEEGSAAAPTAGLHFTDSLLKKIKEKEVQMEFVTLHVGLGTFQSVKTENIKDHQMHSEWFKLDKSTAKRLNEAKKKGKKIIAVGTTSVRVLESCASVTEQMPCLTSQTGDTDIFIYPGYEWKFVDQLITNFHVPQSTLLMLVSSLAGKNFVLKAYEEAKRNKYRFFSFGDAMWIQ